MTEVKSDTAEMKALRFACEWVAYATGTCPYEIVDWKGPKCTDCKLELEEC